jgi:hypothetical protein
MKITSTLITGIMLLLSTGAMAQHDHSQMQMEGDSMQGMKMPMQHQMPSTYSRYLPMNRDGSGTGWQPDESPLMMYMLMKKHTGLMWHGAIYPRLTVQDVFRKSDRGGARFSAPNWTMFMLNQYIGQHGTFNFTSMLSLDLLTEYNGYPLLFQSGETYNGRPLVDRQHPHDLFAGLSVAYTHSFNKDIDLTGYFGFPGEPALGPVVFMHRISAVNNPDAPIGHHWQDASHITFGVATIGFRYKIVKLEGSIFTGREPDEKRYDFDKPRFDSYSYRVSLNPISQLSMQFSQGFIHSPEALEPTVNIMRTTASVTHVKRFKEKSFIASSLIWGYNRSSEKENLHSLLAESNLRLKPLSIYGRYEWVEKDAHELQLLSFDEHTRFQIHAITLGLNVPIIERLNTELSIGSQVTLNVPDNKLKPIYGNYPLSAQVYLKLTPAIAVR